MSDPGRQLIQACIKKDITVVPIPGVSSITAAMSASEVLAINFFFMVFCQKKENELDKNLSLLGENSFLSFFIQVIKVNFYLKAFQKYFSGRKILIAKEITKLHEVFLRADVDKINLFKTPLKGELTVVISEKNIKDKILNEKMIIKKAKLYLKKYSLKML